MFTFYSKSANIEISHTPKFADLCWDNEQQRWNFKLRINLFKLQKIFVRLQKKSIRGWGGFGGGGEQRRGWIVVGHSWAISSRLLHADAASSSPVCGTVPKYTCTPPPPPASSMPLWPPTPAPDARCIFLHHIRGKTPLLLFQHLSCWEAIWSMYDILSWLYRRRNVYFSKAMHCWSTLDSHS